MEIWKDIQGWNGKYQVSNYGNVRSANYRRTGLPSLMKLQVGTNGRIAVVFHLKNKAFNQSVHRLVATEFIPNPENKPQVNHIDGNPKNNAYSNLEWCNQSENMKHSFENGLHKRMYGEDSKNNKLKYQDVMEVLSSPNKTLREFSEKFNVTIQTIHLIRKRKTWCLVA